MVSPNSLVTTVSLSLVYFMWQLTSPNLSYFEYYANSANNLSILTPDTSLTGSGLLTTLFQQLTKVNTSVTVGSEPDIYNFTTTSIPLTVTSGNTIFKLASDYSNPLEGEFTFNNNIVTIHSSTTLTTVSYINNPPVTTLTVKTIPSFFYNLPAIGGFSITDSWQDHPTANLVFITKPNQLQQYRTTFRNGALIDIYGYSFVVNSYSEDISKEDYSATVSVSLRGKWEMFMNLPIELNRNAGILYKDFQDPECQIGYESPANTSYISANGLASRVGARLTGIDFTVKVPTNTSDSVTTTLSGEIEKWLDIKGSVLDYSNANAIVVRNLNAAQTHFINDSILLSNFNTTINRTPIAPVNSSSVSNNNINYTALVPTTITNKPYFSTFENTNLIPKPTIQNYTVSDVFNDGGNKIVDEPTQTLPPRYEQRKVKRRTYDKGDLDAASCPLNVIKLTDLSLNFDKSGVTKTVVTVTEEDGFPITEVTRRYGFAYRAVDITKVITNDAGDLQPILEEGNPANWWKLIEEKVTTYLYDNGLSSDSGTGYLLGYDIVGRRLLRSEAEGDDLYTQEYYLEFNYEDDSPEPTNFEIAKYNTYGFRYVPLYGAKRYLLNAHRDYYKNFENEEKYYKKCNKDGSSSWEVRPDYVEPMFAIGEAEEISCYLQTPDPRNLLRDPESDPPEPYFPDKSTGEESYRRSFIKILDSKNTGKPNYTVDSNLPEQDRYITFNSNFSAQEPGFGVVVEETSTSQSDGIPPVHTRKPPAYELVEPDKEDKSKEQKQFRYVLFTNPYNGGFPRAGSFSFEKATKINEVISAVTNQLKIDDIRNTLSSSCTIPLNMNIKSGDKVVVSVEGTTYKRRVTSVQHNFVFEGVNTVTRLPLVTGTTQLTMGIDRDDITVSSIKEAIPKPNSNNSNSSITDVIEYGVTLGSLLPSNLPGRGR